MQWNIYTAGTAESRTLLGRFDTFPRALEAWEMSQDTESPAWLIAPAGTRDELAKWGNLSAIVPGYDLGSYGKGVFTIDCGGGFSTLGFGYAQGKAKAVAEWLVCEGAIADPGESGYRGTPESFLFYQRMMQAGAAYNRETGKRCEIELCEQLAGLEGKRVEVVDKHGETRRFTVGRSTGWLPIHLEIERPNDDGGGSVTGAPFKSVRVLS